MKALKYIALAAGLLCATGVTAQVDRSKLPAPGPAPEIKLGTYETFELKNGLKVIVVRNTKLPQVSYSLLIDRDPIVEGDKAGYVSLAGQLLRSGTSSRTKDQIDEEIDFIGASLSTSSTGVYGSSLSRHKEKLFALMADVVLNPSFPQAEFDRLLKQTKSGMASQKDNPQYIANRVQAKLLYGAEHPYGELNSEATLDNISLQDVQQYYQTYFKPNAAYLAIVGDITKKEAQKLANQYFGKWKKGTVPTHQYASPAPLQQPVIAVVDRPSSVQSIVQITHPIALKPADADVIPARLMNDILGGSDARLFNNLREAKGYTYGAYSSLDSDKLIGKFVAYANVRNAVTDSAVAEFMNELNRIRTEPVPQDELQKAKNFLTGSFARSLESPQTIASFALNTQRYGLDKNYYRDYLKKVAAVTPQDLQRVAQKYVQPDKAYILVVGNADEVAPGLSRFGKVSHFTAEGEPAKELSGDVDAQGVINNYLTAIGGEKKLAAVKDMRIVMKINFNGMEITNVQAKKLPGSYLNETSMNGQTMSKIIVADGKAFMAMGGQRQEVPAQQAAAIKIGAYPFPELMYAKEGITVELKGMEQVEGQEAYKLAIGAADGPKVIEYFAKESGLKLKTEGPTGTVLYKAYEEREGIKFPTKITMVTPQGALEGELTTLELNKGIAESVFN
ncbi:insulinase family protein [Cesiribacter andamanensis]|uniref:Peptidase M16 inactive domain protein n=1 Tax=Cesiribacter andamanensis AMV16 TaxID=1279009 RepID=M7MY46_9BACT|nr:insulinase family protein [Cesiribacter andamanensis]EMR01358.1 Peptidase M16 inactive domain protein [Cesiribacter andamanensis AMV16]